MERVLQIFCDLLDDLGVATEALQQEFQQCLDNYAQEDQQAMTEQFVSQLKIVFASTENKETQTDPQLEKQEKDKERPTKRQKTKTTTQDTSASTTGDVALSKDDVQITASKEELDKRISTFTAMKKLDNGLSNQREFCEPTDGTVRTMPTKIQRKHQIKLSKNESVEGPLNTTHTTPADTKTLHPHIQLPWGVEERLKNLEHFVDVILPVPSDVYERLKALEDKVLFLEDRGYLDAKSGKSKPEKQKSEKHKSEKPKTGKSEIPSPTSPPPPRAVDPNRRIA